MNTYTILFKKVNNYPTWLCDRFEDDEIWTYINDGWRLIE